MSAKPSRTPCRVWTVTSATSCSSLDEPLPCDAASAFSITFSACARVITPFATSDRRSDDCKMSEAMAIPRAISSIRYPPRFSLMGHPITDARPPVRHPPQLHRPRTRHAGGALPAKTAYLDGEIAVLTAEGVSDFGALQEALGGHGGSREMSFIAFDLVPGRPRSAAAAPDRTQGDPGEATGQAAGEEPGSNLRPCDHPVARVLRPCMQAAPGGHHLKAGELALSFGPRWRLGANLFIRYAE